MAIITIEIDVENKHSGYNDINDYFTSQATDKQEIELYINSLSDRLSFLFVELYKDGKISGDIDNIDYFIHVLRTKIEHLSVNNFQMWKHPVNIELFEHLTVTRLNIYID